MFLKLKKQRAFVVTLETGGVAEHWPEVVGEVCFVRPMAVWFGHLPGPLSTQSLLLESGGKCHPARRHCEEGRAHQQSESSW